jgi:hypothetical protein
MSLGHGSPGNHSELPVQRIGGLLGFGTVDSQYVAETVAPIPGRLLWRDSGHHPDIGRAQRKH